MQLNSLLIPSLLCMAALQASAAIVQVFSTTAATLNAYTVSSTDLLQTSLASVASSGYTAFTSGSNSFGSPTTVLNNGSAGTGSTATTNWANLVFEASDGPATQFTVTYTLDLTAAPFGYDITTIETFAGWSDARASQKYEVFYSTVGDSDFTQMGTTFGGAFSNGSTRNSISENTTGVLASNVDQIRFAMLSTGTSTGALNGDVWQEIDVMGVATVPEPSAILLGGLGMLALLRRRRN